MTAFDDGSAFLQQIGILTKTKFLYPISFGQLKSVEVYTPPSPNTAMDPNSLDGSLTTDEGKLPQTWP